MSEFLFPLAQSDAWADDFFGIDNEGRFVVILVVIGCTTAILISLGSVFAGVWHSIRHKQIEADLKQDMLDRGMSSEEIEQVIEARPREGIDRWINSWGKRRKT
jgi:hypothetical protein